MEIISSLSQAIGQLRKDALSNSVIYTYGNGTQTNIPFYPIQNSFDIFNTQWEFEIPN